MHESRQQKHLDSDPEEIEDVLRMIEKSYDIKFEGIELLNIRTFGQLVECIASKITFVNRNDCTGQQAFYKLRSAIMTTKKADRSAINLRSQLTDIFPRRTRRRDVKAIEKRLCMDLKMLQPFGAVTNFLIFIFFLSIVVLFLKWEFGIAGLFFSIIALWISEKIGMELRYKTLGDLTERMTQLNYAKSRRQPGTMNANEIRDKIEKLFIYNLALETIIIDDDTVIV